MTALYRVALATLVLFCGQASAQAASGIDREAKVKQGLAQKEVVDKATTAKNASVVHKAKVNDAAKENTKAKTIVKTVNKTPPKAPERMEVQVFRGAGVSNRVLAVGEVGFANRDAVGELPAGDAQWESYWDTMVQAYRKDGRQAIVKPENQHAQLRSKVYREDCTHTGRVAYGPIAQGGVNAQGQRWAKIAVRSVDLETQTVDGCVVQAPAFTELHFEGVLDSNPEQVFVVEQAGEVYTFRFVSTTR